MKLVKFDDGSFGVRAFSLLGLRYVFRDFSSPHPDFWWPIGSVFISDCKTSEIRARKFLTMKRVDYEVIK